MNNIPEYCNTCPENVYNKNNVCYNIAMTTIPEPKVKNKDLADVPRGKIAGYLRITPEQQREFYLSLARMTYLDAAKKLGISDRYTTDSSLKQIGYRLYKETNPEELGISSDAIAIVSTALAERKSKAQTEIMDGANPEVLDSSDSKQLVIGGKNKAALLLHKKMDMLMNSKKRLDAVPVSQLATMFGILFDKAQIIQGEATENIAVMAQVKKDMNPQEALDALLKIREFQQEQKHE